MVAPATRAYGQLIAAKNYRLPEGPRARFLRRAACSCFKRNTL
jgi:hypothetical protein